jgi:putative hydrolase of the HAD superfamily
VKRRQVQCALFDLDNTMYPKSSGVMDTISQRINAYMAERLGMDEALIGQLRPRYWKEYGTTLRGLYVELGADPEDYLAYVHGFSVRDMLAPNAELDQVLGRLPWRKVILTSASGDHAHRVLTALGVRQHFERIFGIEDTGYVCKPHPSAYRTVLDSLGVGAEDSIMLDDSIANLRAAGALGMLTVLVGSTDHEDGADFVIRRIEEAGDVTRLLARKVKQ